MLSCIAELITHIDGVNNPNSVEKIKNTLLKDIKEFEKDNHINIAISEIMYIDDCEAKEEAKLQSMCKSKGISVSLFVLSTNERILIYSLFW